MSEFERLVVTDRLGGIVADIDPTQVMEAETIEEVNGENSLALTTTQELAKTDRILMRDGMGKWHEWVVTGIGSSHEEYGVTWHEYYAVWSLQYDLSVTFVNDQYGAGLVPGHESSPVTARTALEVALEGTSRWAIGTVTVATRAAASFYRRSGWEAMKTVLEVWGGELQASITMGTSGVTERAVDLLAHVGNETTQRRFDLGGDVSGIRRTVSDDPWPCRIIPLGKASETDKGGYTRRPTIESVNDGVMWLENSDVVPYVRVPNGSGGWEYPTSIIQNDTYEEPADLKAWALAHLSEYTQPVVSYEASVTQLAAAGTDLLGVALGDEIAVVDSDFGGEGLRLTSRVLKIRRNLLDESDMSLTIGTLRPTLGGQITSIARQVDALTERAVAFSQWQGSTEWLETLIQRLNDAYNQAGTYHYTSFERGEIWSNVPLDENGNATEEGGWAMNINGLGFRLASSLNEDGTWNWRTFGTGEGITADEIIAGTMSAGMIQSPVNPDTYIDLTNGVWQIASGATIGGRTVEDVLAGMETMSDSITSEADARANLEGDLQDYIASNDALVASKVEALERMIDGAEKVATNWLSYDASTGELTLAASDSVVRNVLTNTGQVYRTDAGDIAWFGLNGTVWQLYIETAEILNYLRFGDFAWIRRDNGNMTLKWVGAS